MIRASQSPNSLSGKRIVVTRAAGQADDLDELLRSRGVEPLPYPCIAIAPPEDTILLDAALHSLASGTFDWLVLTSRNTVAVLVARLADLGLNAQATRPVCVAAVGEVTAAAAERDLGVKVDLMPAEFVAESLVAALRARLHPGDRVLLCQADIARPLLAEELGAAGVQVTAVVAYRTIPGSGGVALPSLLADHHIDAITFTSSSTVRNFLQRLQAEGGSHADLDGVCLACLGPVAAGTARQLGLTVHVAPEAHTLPALVEALEVYFSR